MAAQILHAYTDDVWDYETVHTIVSDSLNFDIPLVQISDNRAVLELFHGPTEAFKDVGARFMARAMSHFLNDEKITILVATSGDTGSAVADGFWHVDGIDVVVLFPKGGVSPYQESQMTTLGDNIYAVEVEGTFDDCQDLVKRAFQDETLQQEKKLSSANSINIGRLLPQSLYYYFIAQQLRAPRSKTSICVPSGNFGNITSGLYAHFSGLHFGQFVAATNANTTFPEYLTSGMFRPRPSVATLSNAMDVGKPSNFVRMVELFDEQQSAMQPLLKSMGISDETTLQTMKKVYDQYDYILDPHAAVGWAAFDQLDKTSDWNHVVLGTAHPRKFERAVQLALPEIDFTFPNGDKPSHKVSLPNQYDRIRDYIASV